MLLHVYFQSARLCGGVVALFASERFLTSVSELVPLHVTCLCTLETALIAMKGLLSTVSEHMLVEASIYRYILSAIMSLTVSLTGFKLTYDIFTIECQP